MDDAERGEQHEQLNRDIALRRHASRPQLQTPEDGCCVECGEPIEAARIQALGSVETCAECAHRAELQARIGGRRV